LWGDEAAWRIKDSLRSERAEEELPSVYIIGSRRIGL
jgi:hypothetical protein